MTMVERVARSIATRTWRLDIDEFKEPARWAQAEDAYDLTNNNGRYGFDEIARAAIEAMRNPMNDMVDVGTEARWQSAVRDANSVREIWSHMIDAALKEHDGA